jgi:hypothetical protein
MADAALYVGQIDQCCIPQRPSLLSFSDSAMSYKAVAAELSSVGQIEMPQDLIHSPTPNRPTTTRNTTEPLIGG